MDHDDHVNLLRDGIPEPGGTWADLGSGSGAFTLALAELLGPEAEIYSVDRDRRALRQQARRMRKHARFPRLAVHYLPGDFSGPLDLPPLDGIVMANSLHFQRDPEPVLRLVHGYLRPGGRLLLVEYDTDRGNVWVPHPISYQRWQELARKSGFIATRRLRTRPSRFLGQIYAALSLRPPDATSEKEG
ncbi:MAG: class I SAM-dependent methyltransferase [Anaerolineae bacterium]|jgi:SAM-dependent methyltransferase